MGAGAPQVDPPPFTACTATEAGWIWRIPLSHRTGFGHVHVSDLMDRESATQRLLDIAGGDLQHVRELRFAAGVRRRQWSHNCVAIGLAAGFLEPLESTGIHLALRAATRLVELFPHRGNMALLAAPFNTSMNEIYAEARDFLVLHYFANQRHGESFWDDRRSMALPGDLSQILARFLDSGRLDGLPMKLFKSASWNAVLTGQHQIPNRTHPSAGAVDRRRNLQFLARVQACVADAVNRLPTHGDHLRSVSGSDGKT